MHAGMSTRGNFRLSGWTPAGTLSALGVTSSAARRMLAFSGKVWRRKKTGWLPMKNPNAVALGQLARGHSKNFSPSERRRRRAMMQKLNERRKAERKHDENKTGHRSSHHPNVRCCSHSHLAQGEAEALSPMPGPTMPSEG